MPNLVTSGFRPGDDEKVVAILNKWDGGVLSDALFTAIAKIIPQPIVEVVVLRKRDGNVETLLIPRPQGDIVWAGMPHTPGQALRLMDFKRDDHIPLNGPFERVRNRELDGVEFTTPPQFVTTLDILGERGAGVLRVFWVTIPGNANIDNSQWVNVEELSEMSNFIPSQLVHVLAAANHFVRNS